MSNPGDADTTPATTTRQLADYLASGCRERSDWRIGTEHEKFGFSLTDLAAPPYDGSAGIAALLDGLHAAKAAEGWTPILDRGHSIGLKGPASSLGASLSLEPGGQFELSGGALTNLHQTRQEFQIHFAELHRVAAPLGLGFAPLGFQPLHSRAAIPWMPKGRYEIMRAYMPKVGTLGLDMMLRTCTVQVNLDTQSEADMVRKFRVALAFQPVATALFANSPFTEGKPNGYLSYRAHIWTDTDPHRTGLPGIVFEDGFGFERWTEWLLDVPMYFVHRPGEGYGGYVDVAGASFRDFMAGRLPGREGERPTIGDFADHTTTAFPEVRLKRFLEMRGADAGSMAMMLAQSALWVGLLYDDAALEAATALMNRHGWQSLVGLRSEVARQAVNTPFADGTVRDLARDLVAIAADGLRARGQGEEVYLDPLRDIVEGGAPTQAEHWLNRYQSVWAGDVSRIFNEAQVA
ncbi:glutamate--cysteine ligase [Granulibacter bethesdensis]|uniref:glutamate--cysteine ligase n=1 Tax=Granulibacter bethesdensis TaxID=364410 RepID=UPI0003F1CAC9|nr:glutamate--cysteine ligase [Granulibacter bethesdensis]AHJ65324.1 Glutamate--cysteine ligase [Granulibacter bethesdensis CGDNIH4]